MKHTARFFIAARNNVVGLALLVAIWFILAQFFPDYVLPSPVVVLSTAPTYLDRAFAHHLLLTGYRLAVG